MKLDRILMLAVIVIYIANTALAQNKYDADDYKNPDNYKKPDFYKTSDPELWDYQSGVINWDLVDYTRTDIYKVQAFYDNLPDAKWSEVDYRLVNYDMVQDHSKIDSNKYLYDSRCMHCVIYIPEDLKRKNLVRYGIVNDHDPGLISHLNGDKATVRYYPQETIFQVTEKGIIAIFPQGGLIPSFRDTLTISGKDLRFIVVGEKDSVEYRLDEGRLVMKEGDFIVSSAVSSAETKNLLRYARINGVYIQPEETDVILFFDGKENKECKCNYVSFGDKQLVSGSAGESGFIITFKGRNPYVYTKSSVNILHKFGTITVKNRAEEKPTPLIPEIIMQFEPQGFISKTIGQIKLEPQKTNIVRNGDVMLSVYEDGTTTQAPCGMKDLDSTSLVLSLQDEEGKSLMGTEKDPKKIIMDNNNRVASISQNNRATSKQESMLFYLPEETKIVIKKAQEASKNKEEYKKEIEEEVSVAPMIMFGWINELHESEIVDSLRRASDINNFNAGVLAAMAFNEGVNKFIEDFFYDDSDQEISGFTYLGLDEFGSNVDELKKRGFLRKDFSEYEKVWKINEKGKKVLSADFKNLAYGLEAFGAQMAQRRDAFIRDAKSYGYNTNSLKEEEINYWTYMYYNCGEECARYRLRRDGVKIPTTPGRINERDPVGNSQRVVATIKLLKKAGIFDNTIYEEISATGGGG